jgi:5-methylcytosine-specific restriction endonuclease McrA
MEVKCDYCDASINKKPSQVKLYKHSFCDKYCRSNYFSKKFITECKTCRKEVERRNSEKNNNGNYFCSKSCSSSWNNQLRKRENHPNWKTGKNSYRVYALREKENKCERCGYDKYTEILQVHHKNKDRNDTSLENLELLCPNCHCIEHYVK